MQNRSVVSLLWFKYRNIYHSHSGKGVEVLTFDVISFGYKMEKMTFIPVNISGSLAMK